MGMNEMKFEGKEAIFQRYYQAKFSQLHCVEKNTPNSMVSLKHYDTTVATLSFVIRKMEWVDELKKWGEENGKTEKINKMNEKLREKFGTKEEPKEHFRFKDTDKFRRQTLAYYDEAIGNQGISHEDFMQRFENEFSDILMGWEETYRGKEK
jgi:hypothetical protein